MVRYLKATILLFSLTVFLTAASGAKPQYSQKRIDGYGRYALVIGVDDLFVYDEKYNLKTPYNNANDVAWALHNAGFSVTILNEFDVVSTEAFLTGVDRVSGQLSKDPNSIGLIYFSGDSSALIFCLSDFLGEEEINKQARAGKDSSECDFLLAYLAQHLPSTNRLNVIIADASFKHSFPYRRLTINKEIPNIPLTENIIFFSATQPEKTHTEGTRRNSPFTAQLLKVLGTSDQSLMEIIQSVTDQVRKSTRDKQQPWHSKIRKPGLEKEILIPKEVREWANQMSPNANQKRPQSFRDCAGCPEMVMLPPGRFMMGSPGTEPGQAPQDSPGYRREGPQHSETIPQALAMGKYEVTRAEFAQFAEETGYDFINCSVWTRNGGSWWKFSWQKPGYAQENNHPVACINLSDAQAYTDWLSRKTRKKYRLPTEAEWEYAARAGTQSSRYWGDKSDRACKYANVADRSLKKGMPDRATYAMHKCEDGYAATSPVGHFEPNQFGLYDMIGNVWEWTTTGWRFCGHFAPGGPGASLEKRFILKGGSWNTRPPLTRSAYRIWDDPVRRYFTYGFRVVRDR